jgi:hypothetical protein
VTHRCFVVIRHAQSCCTVRELRRSRRLPTTFCSICKSKVELLLHACNIAMRLLSRTWPGVTHLPPEARCAATAVFKTAKLSQTSATTNHHRSRATASLRWRPQHIAIVKTLLLACADPKLLDLTCYEPQSQGRRSSLNPEQFRFNDSHQKAKYPELNWTKAHIAIVWRQCVLEKGAPGGKPQDAPTVKALACPVSSVLFLFLPWSLFLAQSQVIFSLVR